MGMHREPEVSASSHLLAGVLESKEGWGGLPIPRDRREER